MKSFIAILLIFICYDVYGQSKINIGLKKQMDSLMILESYRQALHPMADPLKKDTTVKGYSAADRADYAGYWKQQYRIDSTNVAFVDSVFKKYGYPGTTLVGNESSQVAWLIIQHAKDVNKYLPIIKKAAEEKELRYTFYAMMVDRQLISDKKEQLYGTQAVCRKIKSEPDVVCFIWPIKDAATVNQRRKQAGFDSTVEENAKLMNIKYRALKLEDVL